MVNKLTYEDFRDNETLTDAPIEFHAGYLAAHGWFSYGDNTIIMRKPPYRKPDRRMLWTMGWYLWFDLRPFMFSTRLRFTRWEE